VTEPGFGTPDAPIVFLHIPKTAGQTIHSELARVVGDDAVSPVRVHTQAKAGTAQMPAGFGLYSGHIDWEALDTLPQRRFVFTVLRDPLERIASFYFYLLREAEGVSAQDLQRPERTGLRMITTRSADDYFFGGDQPWQRFVHDHYCNVYCAYFATRKMRGWTEIADLEHPDVLRRAMAGTSALDAIYGLGNLDALEDEVARRTGQRIRIADRYVNAGPDAGARAAPALRWPALRERFEHDRTAARILRFVQLDQRLMTRLGLAD
jgi:sulfotransferase famil protein